LVGKMAKGSIEGDHIEPSAKFCLLMTHRFVPAAERIMRRVRDFQLPCV
jgi:hypothetical protein